MTMAHAKLSPRASVGSLLASSYCERVNSASKIIFNDSNSLCSHLRQMNMLAILRINKEFMDYMREHCPHIAKQRFGFTLLTPQGDDVAI
jgi:hypothetical protein